MAKTERLRNKRMHRSIHSTLEQMLEVIKRVQSCRGEEIVNAQNRARAGNPANTRIQEDKGEWETGEESRAGPPSYPGQ